MVTNLFPHDRMQRFVILDLVRRPMPPAFLPRQIVDIRYQHQNRNGMLTEEAYFAKTGTTRRQERVGRRKRTLQNSPKDTCDCRPVRGGNGASKSFRESRRTVRRGPNAAVIDTMLMSAASYLR
jgi:hypothetical protein